MTVAGAAATVSCTIQIIMLFFTLHTETSSAHCIRPFIAIETLHFTLLEWAELKHNRYVDVSTLCHVGSRRRQCRMST
ncbi:hypothetical protein NECAME_15937 [Necator americanus]|uniref:Uncharacterized protein n=1 Tax=Necator americanus TaxID=51031 RepID=W2SHM2_NECAM|nr:hypothetical protein NECAME_15937 [Necator americanus]ETN68237.1 hypothetical protein NECAME_15937 [Necator americanus]